jgi:hypothetical protein
VITVEAEARKNVDGSAFRQTEDAPFPIPDECAEMAEKVMMRADIDRRRIIASITIGAVQRLYDLRKAARKLQALSAKSVRGANTAMTVRIVDFDCSIQTRYDLEIAEGLVVRGAVETTESRHGCRFPVKVDSTTDFAVPGATLPEFTVNDIERNPPRVNPHSAAVFNAAAAVI